MMSNRKVNEMIDIDYNMLRIQIPIPSKLSKLEALEYLDRHKDAMIFMAQSYLKDYYDSKKKDNDK